jgi:type III secretion protein L
MVFVVRQSSGLDGEQPDTRLAPAGKVVKAADVWAFKEAQALVADARRRAADIIAGAEAALEAERVRGYQEGLEQAKLEAAGQMMETVGRTVDYFARVEDRIVALVIASMKRVVEDFDDRTRVLAAVRNSLSFVRSQKQLTLRVHPERADIVKANLGELLSRYPGIGFLDVVGDPRLAGDACIVESEIGVVEASFDGLMQALGNAFGKVFNHGV